MTSPHAFDDGLPPDTRRSEWRRQFMRAVDILGPIRAHFSARTGHWWLDQHPVTMKAIVVASEPLERDRRRRIRRRLGLTGP